MDSTQTTEKILWDLSRKALPNGTVFKNPAVLSEASRIANPVAIAGSCAGTPIEAQYQRVAERLMPHHYSDGTRADIVGVLGHDSETDVAILRVTEPVHNGAWVTQPTEITLPVAT